MENRQLNESQLKAFLHDEGIPERMSACLASLPDRIGRPIGTILDCGGGNGLYLDKLLEIFPDTHGTLIDSAQYMLDRNVPHPRKRLLSGNLENPETLFDREETFDLICFFDVLHHCIAATYTETRALQTAILKTAASHLSRDGRILVSERLIDSWITDEYSAHLTYALTRSRTLSCVTRLFGANTAGVGVCFASTKRFRKLCDDAGLRIVEAMHLDGGTKRSLKSRLKRLLWYSALAAKGLRNDFFLLSRN